MGYETLLYKPDRVTPIKFIKFSLEKIAVFNSTSPDICRIVNGAIFRVSDDHCCYKINLATLNESLEYSNKLIRNEFVLVSQDFIYLDTDDGSIMMYSPVSKKAMPVGVGSGLIPSASNVMTPEGALVVGRDRQHGKGVFLTDTELRIRQKYIDKGMFDSFAYDSISKLILHDKGMFCCFHVANGLIDWRIELDNAVLPGPLTNIQSRVHIFDKTVIAGSKNLYIIGLDLDTGKLKWKQQLKGDVNYLCVDWRGRVYKVSHNYLYVLNAATGEILLEKTVAIPDSLEQEGLILDTAFCDVTESHFFGITLKGLLYAVNLETARLEWYDDTREMYQMGRPFIIHGNRLYLQTVMSNRLIIYEGQGGYQPDVE